MRSDYLTRVRRGIWKDLLYRLFLLVWITWMVYANIKPAENTKSEIHLFYIWDSLRQGGNPFALFSVLYPSITAFLLLGVLNPLAQGKRCLSDTLLLAGMMAAVVEILQFLFRSGIVCCDDILLAVLGAYIGYQAFLWLCVVIPRGGVYLQTYDNPDRSVWLLFLVLVMAVSLFFTTSTGKRLYHEKLEQYPNLASALLENFKATKFSDYAEEGEKEIGRKLYEGFADYRSEVTVNLPGGMDMDVIIEQYRILCDEHPELFWLSGGCEVSGIRVGGMTACTVHGNYISGVEDLRSMDSLFQNQVNTIAVQAERLETDAEKVRFVHDYLVNTTEYDTATLFLPEDVATLAHTAYGCLVDHRAVCSGYAYAFQLLMNRLGIPCGYVTGTARNSEGVGPHGWNYVCIDGEYSYVDVTWDDPISLTGNSDNLSYDYYCISAEQMAQDHFLDDGQYIPEELRIK